MRPPRKLDQVLSYIEGRSLSGARNVEARIRAAIDLIAYLIFYAAGHDEVVIHGVRHAARRPIPD